MNQMAPNQMQFALIKIVQKALVIDAHGKVLFIQRNPDNGEDKRRGKWDLPGGNFEVGDLSGEQMNPMTRALLREVKEETCLKEVTIEDRFIDGDWIHKADMLGQSWGYKCSIIESEPTLSLDPNEHTAYKWLTPEEAVTLDVGDDGGLIHTILGRFCDVQ